MTNTTTARVFNFETIKGMMFNRKNNTQDEMVNMESTVKGNVWGTVGRYAGTVGHYVGMGARKVWDGAKYVYNNLKGRVVPLTVYTGSAFAAVAVSTTVGGALLATAAISAATMTAIYMLIAKIKKEKIQFRVAVLAMLIHGFASAITMLSFFLFGIIPTLVADLVISYIQVEAVKFI